MLFTSLITSISDDNTSIRKWKQSKNKLNSWIRWENANLINIESVRSKLNLIWYFLHRTPLHFSVEMCCFEVKTYTNAIVTLCFNLLNETLRLWRQTLDRSSTNLILRRKRGNIRNQMILVPTQKCPLQYLPSLLHCLYFMTY